MDTAQFLPLEPSPEVLRFMKEIIKTLTDYALWSMRKGKTEKINSPYFMKRSGVFVIAEQKNWRSREGKRNTRKKCGVSKD